MLFFQFRERRGVRVQNGCFHQRIGQKSTAIRIFFENSHAAFPALQILRERKSIFAAAENYDVRFNVFALFTQFYRHFVKPRGLTKKRHQIPGFEFIIGGWDDGFLSPPNGSDPNAGGKSQIFDRLID